MRICKAFAATLVLAATLFVFGPASPASAQSSGFHISDQTITMAIQKSGLVDVKEVINVDFANEAHHGIFRTIHVRFDYDPEPKYERIYQLSHIHVTATGASAKTSITDPFRDKQIKIGDGNKTVTGKHTYTITYTIKGALNGFEDHDELYWNAVGFDWQIPIDKTTVIVTAPEGLTQVACYEGPNQSTLPCESSQLRSPQEAQYEQSVLYPGQGMSVIAALKKGVIEPAGVLPLLDEKFSLARAFSVTKATTGGAGAIAVVIALLLFRLLWKTGRDRSLVEGTGKERRRPLTDKHGGPVQYRPPGDARVAQVGVLLDEKADPLDVTATIIDFGVRGYLTLEETEKAGWFHKADWKLTKVKDAGAEFLPYETKLFKGLFDSRDEVRLSELRNTFAKDLKAVQDSLYADCVGSGWFAKRPDKVRSKYLVFGILAVIASVIFMGIMLTTHAALLAVPVVLGAVVFAVGHRYMPARTGKGSAALDQVIGFRHYMATAEADQMKFAEEENLFAKYLPYAIIFHETDRWAKAFSGIYGEGVQPGGMGWSYPYGGWNTFNFGNSFGSSMSSFTTQTSGTIVSTPASSGGSGFGGGGFSGGGGGGGGGGGW